LSAVDWNLSDAEKQLLESAKQKMGAARSLRVRPHLDDKVLASWNGLMLGALARAGVVLNEVKYLAAAKKNLAFVQKNLWQHGTLYHRWREGERDTVQLLEGYAFLLAGVIELYEATLEPEHLDFAIALAEAMGAKFYDSENGGFWQGAPEARDLILRVKDDYDGAEPSGNSAATLALLKLAAITGREDFKKYAETTLRLFAYRLQNFPQAMPFMLQALDFSLNEPRRVVIAGNPGAKPFQKLLQAAHAVYQPNKVVLGNRGAVDAFTQTLPATDDPAVYLCTGNSCRPPTNDGVRLRELLR
jgi:uncharacterized protein YyaL (SSP411 family)